MNRNLWMALWMVAGLAAGGCASHKVLAYQTLKATETTVDAALQAFADARVHGRVADADYAKVEEAYGKYQVAFKTGVQAAQMDLTKATPAQVSAMAVELVNAVYSILGKSPPGASPGPAKGGSQ